MDEIDALILRLQDQEIARTATSGVQEYAGALGALRLEVGAGAGAFDAEGKAALAMVRVMALLREQTGLVTAQMAMQGQGLRDLGELYDRAGKKAGEAQRKEKDAAGDGTRSVLAALAQMQAGFGAAHSWVASLTQAASPAAWDTLTGSLKLLSGQIGLSFVPYVARASRHIQDAARFVRGLSAEAREGVAKWVMMGGAVMGAGVVLRQLVSTGEAVFTVLRGGAGLVRLGFDGIVGAVKAVWVEVQILGRVGQMALGLLTGNFAAVKAAAQGLWAVIAAHPFLAIAGALAATAAAAYALSGGFDSVGKAADELAQRVATVKQLLEELRTGKPALEAEDVKKALGKEEYQQFLEAKAAGPRQEKEFWKKFRQEEMKRQRAEGVPDATQMAQVRLRAEEAIESLKAAIGGDIHWYSPAHLGKWIHGLMPRSENAKRVIEDYARARERMEPGKAVDRDTSDTQMRAAMFAKLRMELRGKVPAWHLDDIAALTRVWHFPSPNEV